MPSDTAITWVLYPVWYVQRLLQLIRRRRRGPRGRNQGRSLPASLQGRPGALGKTLPLPESLRDPSVGYYWHYRVISKLRVAPRPPLLPAGSAECPRKPFSDTHLTREVPLADIPAPDFKEKKPNNATAIPKASGAAAPLKGTSPISAAIMSTIGTQRG
jgi:hypothetical protein